MTAVCIEQAEKSLAASAAQVWQIFPEDDKLLKVRKAIAFLKDMVSISSLFLALV